MQFHIILVIAVACWSVDGIRAMGLKMSPAQGKSNTDQGDAISGTNNGQFEMTKPVLKRNYANRPPADMSEPDSCMIEGRVYPHGQTVSLEANPCYRILCWYGTLYEREEGCFVGDRCYPVDAVFEVSCKTFKCTKTSWSSTQSLSYNLQILQSRCRDAQGQCRNIGERYSDFQNGEVYEDCWCQRTWPLHTSRTACNTNESPVHGSG